MIAILQHPDERFHCGFAMPAQNVGNLRRQPWLSRLERFYQWLYRFWVGYTCESPEGNLVNVRILGAGCYHYFEERRNGFGATNAAEQLSCKGTLTRFPSRSEHADVLVDEAQLIVHVE